MLSRQSLACLLCVFLLTQAITVHASLTLRPYDSAASGSSEVGTSSALTCDDGTVGGTLVQRLEDWYGNSYEASCAGARVTSVRFQHLSYGLSGPYLYRLHLVDKACTTIMSTEVLQVAPSAAEPTWVQVDLAGDDWCVQGEFQIYLEPLSCVDPLAGQDCFPAVVVDATSDTDPGAHCAQVNTMGTFERTCAAARSTDGRYFDFALRPELQCDTVNCTTAVTPTNWTLLKSLYRAR